MRLSILVLLILGLSGCADDVTVDYKSVGYTRHCNNLCHDRYKTYVTRIDTQSGLCYCNSPE